MSKYDGPERRHTSELTDRQIDAIATRAAEKALDMVYQEVGKAVLRKLAWVLGVAAISVAMYLAGKGYLKP